MSLESDENHPELDAPTGLDIPGAPGFDEPGSQTHDPYADGNLTYEQAMSRIDGLDTHGGTGGTVTYEDAMRAIDAMDTSGHAGTFDDVPTTGLTYEEAIRQIDAMDNPAAASAAEPVPVTEAHAAPQEHEEPAVSYPSPEGVEPSESSASGDTLDLGQGIATNTDSPDAANTDVFADVQIPGEEAHPTETTDAAAPATASHADTIVDDSAAAHADAVVDSTLHGAEPSGEDTSSAAGADAFAGAAVLSGTETDQHANPFDDMNAPSLDEHGSSNDAASSDDSISLQSADTGTAPEAAMGLAHAAAEPASSSADEPPASQTADPEPPVEIDPSLVHAAHDALAQTATEPDSPSSPADNLTSSNPAPEISPADEHGTAETNYVATHPPEAAVDEPVHENTPDTPPVAEVTPDPAEYISHLHEMNSDQVLDSLANQDSPELRQAALEELRSRLHADEASLAAGHPSTAPEVAPVADDLHNADTEPAPSEQPDDAEAAAIPVALSADDVDALLNEKADQSGEDLQWQTSVVDLLKLLGIDSSHEAREHYAVELGFPENELGDTSSSELNTWLHGQLLSTLAQNGGQLPANLV